MSDRPLHRRPVPYLRAVRLANEQLAGQVYFQVQEAMYTGEPNNLSAYRFQLRGSWHVAVLGGVPPAPLGERIEAMLAAGEPATLPAEVVTTLANRRAQARQLGRWVEGHYPPERPR